MIRVTRLIGAALAALLVLAGPVAAQQSVKGMTLSLPSRMLTLLTDNATLTNVEGFATVQIQSVESGDQILTAYCRNDGTNWVAKSVIVNAADGTTSATITGTGLYRVDINGCRSFKVEVTTDNSGSSMVTLLATQAPLGSGGSGGAVTVSSGTISVDNLSQDATVGAAAITTGPQSIGLCDTTNPTAVTDGQAQYMRVDCTTGAKWVTNTAVTTGGVTIHRSIDLDEGTGEVVKASAGQVYGLWVTNTATATRWIKFYDATSCTIGTGTPVITIGVPGNSSDDIAGSLGVGGMGIPFATGICVGAVTGVADADTGAPGANDVIVNIFFK